MIIFSAVDKVYFSYNLRESLLRELIFGFPEAVIMWVLSSPRWLDYQIAGIDCGVLTVFVNVAGNWQSPVIYKSAVSKYRKSYNSKRKEQE